MTSQRTTYLRDDLYRLGPDGPTLRGSRCEECGHVSVPPSRFCPRCRGVDMANVEVGSTATLLSETTVGMPSQRFAPGYRVGYVTLSTGTRLFTHLDPDDELAPGQELRLELIVMWAEHDTDVIAHRFVAKQREKSDA